MNLPATRAKQEAQEYHPVISARPVSQMYSIESFTAIGQMATKFANSRLYGNLTAEQIFVILQAGLDLGISPSAAMGGIHVIQGKQALSGQLMIALVQRGGHLFEILRSDEKGAKVSITRRGSKRPFIVEFTEVEARRAGLIGKDMWGKYPRQMYLNRATSECCRYAAPECLNGMVYAPEDFDVTVVNGQLVGDVDAPQKTLGNDESHVPSRDLVSNLLDELEGYYKTAGVTTEAFEKERVKWFARFDTNPSMDVVKSLDTFVAKARLRASEIEAKKNPAPQEPMFEDEAAREMDMKIQGAWTDIESTMHARGHDDIVTKKVLKDLRKKWDALTAEETYEAQLSWLAEKTKEARNGDL